ncbi:hypothetical protein U2F10_28445 [Leptothoe sp. EHU-05/26/07-4]
MNYKQQGRSTGTWVRQSLLGLAIALGLVGSRFLESSWALTQHQDEPSSLSQRLETAESNFTVQLVDSPLINWEQDFADLLQQTLTAADSIPVSTEKPTILWQVVRTSKLFPDAQVAKEVLQQAITVANSVPDEAKGNVLRQITYVASELSEPLITEEILEGVFTATNSITKPDEKARTLLRVCC